VEQKGGGTILVLVVVAIAAAALYFIAKQLRAGGGEKGGMFSQISGGIRGAMGMSQEVTERSVQTGQTLVSGVGGIATTATGAIKTMAEDLTPDIGDYMPWNW
jgi:hypothetical protein